MILVRIAVLLLLLFLGVSAAGAEPVAKGAPPGATHAPKAHSAHYIVFEIDERGRFQPKFHRAVKLARPPRSLSKAELDRAERDERHGRKHVRVELHGSRGEVVFRDHVDAPSWIRGEFHGPDRVDGGSDIESYTFDDTRGSFVVRVPAGKGRTLVLDGPSRGVFDLEDIAAAPTAGGAATQGAMLPATAPEGDPANRLDLLVMGDGYADDEVPLFATDAEWFANSFFAITPYAEYRSHVNVHALFTPSSQSGADHPPYNPTCPTGSLSCCADVTAQSDPLAGTYVNTAFGARYCANNIHRLLVVDTSAVLAAASSFPDWDQIIVLVNDATYGGAGYGGGLALAVSSTHSSAPDVVRHEVGHSFSGLADEYENPYPGYPTCSDVTGSVPCEPNATDQTSRSRVKWLPWIASQTPTPTPETGSYSGVVGLFEGARYRSAGVYRPRQSECLMRYLGKPFCAVCRQSFVLALYQGWGGSAPGIDPIEPGLEVPPPGDVATGRCGTALSAALLQPAGGPPLAVSWLVNGVAVPGEEQSSFGFVPPAPGNYDVTLRVEDVTPLVAPEMAGTALVSTRSWQVHVSSAECSAACEDRTDNDGDGLIDAADLGCTDASDLSERSPTLVCDNGSDDDGDGAIDHPNDPGCGSPSGTREDPQCNDGVDNDGDGRIDTLDPGCSAPSDKAENSQAACGIGPELAVLLAALGWARRRRLGA